MTMEELTRDIASRSARTKEIEWAYRDAYADMVERGRRLDYNFNGPWLHRFHDKFGGSCK